MPELTQFGPQAQQALDQLATNPLVGGAEGDNPQEPPEQRMGRLITSHMNAGRPWEETQANFLRAFPGEDPERFRQPYERRREHHRQLSEARNRAAGWEESPLGFVGRRAVPFLSAIGTTVETQRYANARRRFEAGSPEPEDYQRIAEYERMQENNAQRGLGGQILSGLAGIPAIAGEAYAGGGALRGLGLAARAGEAATTLGGRALQGAGYVGRTAAQTAAMPSMYLPEAAQRAAGRPEASSPLAPRNLAPAFAVGAMNTAVLGSLAHVANDIPGRAIGDYLRRGAVRTGYGLLEQQAVDVAAGAVGLSGGYGALGDLMQGKAGDALKHLTVQAATFGAFAAMHERSSTPITEGFAAALRELRGRGFSRDGAARYLQNMHEAVATVHGLSEPEPGTREAAERSISEAQGRHVRAYAQSLLEGLPTQADVAASRASRNQEMFQANNVPEALHGEFERREGTQGRSQAISWLAEQMSQEPAASPPTPAEPPGGAEMPPPGQFRQPEGPGYRPPPPEPEHPVQAAARRLQGAEAAHAEALARFTEALHSTRRDKPTGEAMDALRGDSEQSHQAVLQARKELAEAMRQGRPTEPPPAAAPEQPPPPPAERPEGAWHDYGTTFQSHPDGKVTFQGRNGETYHLSVDTHQAPENTRQFPGQWRAQVRVRDTEAKEVGKVDFYRNAAGHWQGEGLRVAEGKDRKTGISGAMYDYLSQLGEHVVPQEGQTPEGKSFWARNRDFARQQAEARSEGVHRDLEDERLYGLHREGREVGTIKFGTVLKESHESRAAQELFPGVTQEGQTFARMKGVNLFGSEQGKGQGQQLLLEGMRQHGADWYFNSQASPQATNALSALARKGLIELHWHKPPEALREAGPFIARVRRAGETPTPPRPPEAPPVASEAPVAPEPAQAAPTQPAAALERVIRRWRSGARVPLEEAQGALAEIATEHGLSERDQRILTARLEGRSYEDVAGDHGVSRQRVQQIEKAALAKLGVEAGTIESLVVTPERLDRALDMVERGHRVSAGDLHADPRETKARVRRRVTKLERVDAEIGRLVEAYEKEQAGGDLPPEREQHYANELSRLSRELEGAGEAAPGAAQERPGGDAERGAGEPTPLRREGGEVPEGSPPAEVPPPRAGGPEVQAPEASTGPGETPGGPAADRPADAPAPAGGGAAGGDQLKALARGFSKPELKALQAAVREKGPDGLEGWMARGQAAEYARAYAESLPPAVEKAPAKERTLLSLIKGEYGISRESALAHGVDVAAVEEAMPGFFRTSKLHKGQGELSEVAERLQREGHLVVPADRHADDFLIEQLVNHATVLDHVAEANLLREQEAYEREKAEALRAGYAPEAVAEALREGLHDGAAEGAAGPLEETGHGAEAHAAEREPGVEPPGEPAGHAPSAGEFDPHADVPFRAERQRRGGIVDHLSEQFGRFLADEGGYFSPGEFADGARQLFDKIKRGVAHVGLSLRELAGRMAPRTTAASPLSGEAVSRFNAAAGYAREAAPLLVDQVLGRNAQPQQRLEVGNALAELRLRYLRAVFQREAQAHTQDAARARVANDPDAAAASAARAKESLKQALGVSSVLGKDGSTLQNEADFRRLVGDGPLDTPEQLNAALQSPALRAITANWKRHMTPLQEEAFRRAEGMEDNEPINARTQLPDFPFTLHRATEADLDRPGVIITGGGRGNLRNVKLGKLGAAREAKGTAEAYVTDLGGIIEQTLAQRLPLAAKAEMMRTLVSEGLARWTEPGIRPEEGWRILPEVRPPRGTQEAEAGQIDLHVDPRAYDEVRRALAPDEPTRFQTLAAVNGMLTKATLVSTVEAAYHSKNLLTMLFKPGVSVVDFFRNVYGVLKDAPGIKERLVELARIGALKETSHLESGMLWGGKTDPTTWMGKFLDVMQRAMRLTADQAFDRLQRQGRVEGSETNRRDFLNQLGQYNRRAQHKAVALLRDTGLGPFATAGTNYYMQSLMSLVASPGAKATSWKQAAGLRAEMLAKMAAVIAVAPLANYFLSGNVNGDDNTPFGGLRLGTGEDGRTSYLDLTNLVGLTRGARQTGLLDLLQGVRVGRTPGQIADRASENILHSLLHPAVGPPVQFAYTVATGKDALGRQVAGKPGEGGSQAWNNLVAALQHANPVVSTFTGGQEGRREQSLGERAGQLLGPYRPRSASALDRFNERYFALSGQRQQFAEQRRLGRAFPQEREYQRFEAFHRAITQLEHAAQGQALAGGRLHQGQRPAEERVRALRAQQVELARRALEAAR